MIGTNNVDHGTGVYCNNSINVLLDMLGVPATTNSIGELARSEVIVVDGVDLARQLPTIGGAVIRAKLAGAKLVVIDTRRHRVAESADYLPPDQARHRAAPLRGDGQGDRGSRADEPAVHQGPLPRTTRRSWPGVRDYDLLAAAESCGVAADLIEAAALAYAQARAAAILYSTGIEARDAETVRGAGEPGPADRPTWARKGAGIFALTEHNNLQGVCDMGMLPDRLPGYRPVASAAARAELERALGRAAAGRPRGWRRRALLTDRGGGKVQGALALPLRPGEHRLLRRRGQRPSSNASWWWCSICS